MKHLKLFFALLAMLALNVGNAWAEETVVYTLTPAKGTNNAYASNCDITISDIIWNLTGNSTEIPWRIGGKSLSKADRTLYSKTAMQHKVTKVEVKHGTNNATVNSFKLIVASDANFSNVISTVDGTFKASSIVTLECPTEADWNNAYYKFVYNVTVSGKSNKYLEFSEAKFYGTASTTPGEGGSTEPAVSVPTFSVPEGTFYSPINVELSCETEGAEIHYTLDGSTPSSTSETYTSAIAISETTTVKAIAVKDGLTDSEVATATYTKGETGALSCTWDLSKKSYSDATTEQVTWSSTYVSMIVEKDQAETAPNSYLGGDANGHTSSRFYQKSSLKIMHTCDVTVTKVVFIATTEEYATALLNSDWGNANATASGTIVTVTPNNPVVDITAPIGKTCDFTGVTVYYTKGDPEPEPEKIATSLVWSQTEYAVTMGETPTFPTLTTTPADLTGVTYSSSNGAVATIAEDGTITIKAAGETTIKASYAGNETYAAATDATYKLTVNKAPATPTENVYVKVTTTAGITNGEYLIVYEDAASGTPAPVAFDGSLTTLDAANNNIAVTISSNTIAGNTDIDAAIFTIDATAGTIKSASGYYIGQTSDANGVSANSSTVYTNTLSIADDGTATIKSSGGAYLRYNSAKDNRRFRYFKSSTYTAQKAIALYKKASKHTVTIASCTNGSVSAKMGETALATNDQVLSGTQITLSNTPATGYKLAAYDVYKTGEAETKVTVTDGKFIMPEFDVTISATFEVAKTLTGIEITNAATQTIFWQTETFNHNGLQVTAHFDGAADEDVTDEVTVTGSTATAGEQTVTVSFIEGTTKTTTYTINVKAIPNTKETAYTVADAFDIIDKLTTANGVFIKGIVSKVDSYNETDKYITYWISDDGTTNKQLQAYKGKGLEGAEFNSKSDLTVSDQVIVVGTLKKFNSTYEFDKNNSLASYTPTTKADPELSYTTTEYNVNLGDAFTTPTLNNPHSLEVTYSSNKEDVATVAADGAVTIKAAGTVTITASFAGDETYLAGNASYTINVTDPSVSFVTFDATQDLDQNNKTQGEGSIAKSPITFACSDGILGNGTEYRLYQDANITFAAENGYAITKVVLTSTASGDSKYGPAKLSTKEGTYTYSDQEGTWVGEAYTVTLTASAQTRATLITVYYKQDNRVDAGIAWSEATVSLTVGDAFTAPTFINPNSLAVSFESSNTELATVDNAGVISLVSGKTGTATITATYAGNETYKAAKVTCVITVSPQSKTVVILAEYNGQWYALKNAEETAGKVLAALPVNYFGGKLYNVAEADKTTIEWQLAIDGTIATFKNGENYISGTAGSADLKLATTECKWTYDDSSYMLGERTFLYRANANGFKNYNASANAGTADYSSLPVVIVPVYATSGVHTRTVPVGYYATVCLPNKIIKVVGATLFEVAGKEGNKVIFDEVITPEAGMPYIFLADENTISFYYENGTEAEAGNHNSLHGTFVDKADGALDGMYMVQNNKIVKCAATGCTIPANRAYFDGTELNALGTAPAPMPGRRRITMGAESENTATGVEGIVAPEGQTLKLIENGQLIIIRDGVKYNAQGVRL